MPNMSKRQIDEVVLISLACGATIDNAAAKANVNPRTVKRRLEEADFQARLRQLKDEMVKRAAAMLTAAAMESVKTLVALLEKDVPPAVRLGAARAILELGVRLRESAELHERITALEQQAATQGVAGKPHAAA